MKCISSFVLGALLALSSSTSAQGLCVMGTYGQGCGPVLTGSTVRNGNTQRVTFAMTEGRPDAVVLFMIGFNELNIPIPGTNGCALLTDLAFSQFHRTNSVGEYSFSRALPSDPTGPTIRVQMLEITIDGVGQPVLRTTNGVTMSCP